MDSPTGWVRCHSPGCVWFAVAGDAMSNMQGTGKDLEPSAKTQREARTPQGRAPKILRSLERVEAQLEKLRGQEYGLPFGSMRRARVSRKWDYYAQERMRLLLDLEIVTARETLVLP